jgi:hypothetical protein
MVVITKISATACVPGTGRGDPLADAEERIADHTENQM